MLVEDPGNQEVIAIALGCLAEHLLAVEALGRDVLPEGIRAPEGVRCWLNAFGGQGLDPGGVFKNDFALAAVSVQLVGRYRKPGTVNVKLEGDILGAAFESSAELKFPRGDDSNPQIERMWANKQVDKLLRQARASGRTSPQSLEISKVVRLCDNFSIVSEYASFIVLENDATGAQTEKHQKRMMGEIAKLTAGSNGALDPADYERTVASLLSGGSDPVITKAPEGAWTHDITDAALN